MCGIVLLSVFLFVYLTDRYSNIAYMPNKGGVEFWTVLSFETRD